MLALMLLGPAAFAVASGRDVLADAQDNGSIDACYSRAEFREALRLARADQRLYGVELEVIADAQITNVTVPGQPCGSGRTVPAGAVPVDSGGWAGLWGGLAAAVVVIAVGAGAWGHRAAGRR
jgi:hypothetical protein